MLTTRVCFPIDLNAATARLAQGWIYFYNHSLRAIADQNIRLPGILEMTQQTYSGYPLSELAEGMEVHLHVQAQKIAEKFEGNNGGIATFNLTINHKHCVASYEIADVMGDNSCLLGPKRRMNLFLCDVSGQRINKNYPKIIFCESQ